ncbi:MAG: hypothetical protein KBA51_00660 [Kiritimatiellae bacterium]|nr:hypothetical protein [Kiritimatiellia bacterium]
MNHTLIRMTIAGGMLCGLASFAQTTIEQDGRQALAAAQDAMIGVSAVVRIEAGSERKDIPVDAFGTVIHESGLVVVSDRMLNPTRNVQVPMGLTLRSSASKIMLRYADGTEVPASNVYSDPDLDLAFLLPRPRREQQIPELKPVTLDAQSQAELLDPVFALGRYPKMLNWEPRVLLVRVTSIARRPRKAYFIDDYSGPGLPVMTTAGKCLGIIAQKSLPSSEMGMGQATPVVVPCADILDLMPTILAAAEKARAEPFESEDEDMDTATGEASVTAEEETSPAPETVTPEATTPEPVFSEPVAVPE